MKDYSALSLQKYLDELASDAPVPGGGSVAAYVAALGLGLMQMVAGVTLKRKIKPELSAEQKKIEEEKRAKLQAIVKEVEDLKKTAMLAVSSDPQVYDEVMTGYSKKLSDTEMDALLMNAYRMQADLAKKIAYALDLNGRLIGLISGAIKNDLTVAQNLLSAAFHGAYHTAHINLVYMKDSSKKAAGEEELRKARMDFSVTGSLS